MNRVVVGVRNMIRSGRVAGPGNDWVTSSYKHSVRFTSIEISINRARDAGVETGWAKTSHQAAKMDYMLLFSKVCVLNVQISNLHIIAGNARVIQTIEAGLQFSVSVLHCFRHRLCKR